MKVAIEESELKSTANIRVRIRIRINSSYARQTKSRFGRTNLALGFRLILAQTILF